MKKKKSLNLTASKLALSKKTIASLSQADITARGGGVDSNVFCNTISCDGGCGGSNTACVTRCATC